MKRFISLVVAALAAACFLGCSGGSSKSYDIRTANTVNVCYLKLNIEITDSDGKPVVDKCDDKFTLKKSTEYTVHLWFNYVMTDGTVCGEAFSIGDIYKDYCISWTCGIKPDGHGWYIPDATLAENPERGEEYFILVTGDEPRNYARVDIQPTEDDYRSIISISFIIV